MTKTEQLLRWLKNKQDWIYLSDVPFSNFNMSRQSASETLTRLCNQGRADFRIQGLKQYRAKNDT